MKDLNKLKRKVFAKNNFWNFTTVLIGALFVAGGLGLETNVVQHVGILVGILLLMLAYIWNKKIVLPRYKLLYLIFIFLFGLSIFWSEDKEVSCEYLVLFIGGGLFWVSFYNLRKELGGRIDALVIILGLIFGGLFIVSLLVGAEIVNSKSLYLKASGYRNHNHLGDLWAVVMLMASYYLIKTKKRLYWPVVGLGIFFLAASLSRAAYLALFLGGIYLFKQLDWFKKRKRIYRLGGVIIVILFLFAGAQKITLFSRPYFIQGIAGFFHNPLGVGVGNFKIISSDSANHLWGMDGFSSLAHNIILEILTGMGVFGFSFVIWLIAVLWDIGKKKRTEKNILYQSLFIALGINFLFSTTYFIPTMLWLWFGYLGISQIDN